MTWLLLIVGFLANGSGYASLRFATHAECQETLMWSQRMVEKAMQYGALAEAQVTMVCVPEDV